MRWQQSSRICMHGGARFGWRLVQMVGRSCVEYSGGRAWDTVAVCGVSTRLRSWPWKDTR
eukprot:15445307-Alexandrium_andersonii.AAC.2